MNYLLSLLLILVIFIPTAIAEPILTAVSNQSGLVKFFIITVDGVELEQIELEELYLWTIFEDLADLNLLDGVHEVTLRFGNDLEESDEIKFFIEVTIFKDSVTYEIQPDPTRLDDPEYLLKFGDNLVAQIQDGEVYIPPDTNDYNDGGGGGGGCFINAISRVLPNGKIRHKCPGKGHSK